MPESPRWLIQKDRQEEALRVLAQVHSGGDVDDPYVQAEYAEIVAKISYEKTHPPPTYYDLLLGAQKRRMWLGIGVVGNINPLMLRNQLMCSVTAILAIHDRHQRVSFGPEPASEDINH